MARTRRPKFVIVYAHTILFLIKCISDFLKLDDGRHYSIALKIWPMWFCTLQLRWISLLFCASVNIFIFALFVYGKELLIYHFVHRRLALLGSSTISFFRTFIRGVIQSCVQVANASDWGQLFRKVFKQVEALGFHSWQLDIRKDAATLTLEVI